VSASAMDTSADEEPSESALETREGAMMQRSRALGYASVINRYWREWQLRRMQSLRKRLRFDGQARGWALLAGLVVVAAALWLRGREGAQ
jgi:hypothetical protein